MKSRASPSTAAPSWGALWLTGGPQALAPRLPPPAPRPAPVGRAGAGRLLAPRFARAARGSPDLAVGALLAALWIGLWAVFTVGVAGALGEVAAGSAAGWTASAPGTPHASVAAARRPAPTPRVRR
ncbi:hypothetical protein AnaeK_0358 [Anaeromyxobacter sp. K]|uniref:hypothetical protein n=1 Tax=Anaeromyxobacter sp. (strain K) TaxID=447217 RepID=UPI00015F9D36|nr:hypothetical protein [Anaeromyxobacter sp. K]ACG71600.1 hypothetical protein AnaeK_0358 [Anaeromyxobacter sp. K]